jgi:hypothetical protein
MSDIVFPIYRKLSNSKSFYKVVKLDEFEEIRLMGTKKLFSKTIAKQYPEKLMIMDLIETNEFYLKSTEEEWSNKL